MTNEDFIRAIEGMTQTLYRVSCTQLRIPADREDAVQETLRRAWEKRHTLREERYMQTWVIRILLNECDRIRRKSARNIPVEEVRAVQVRDGKGALKQAILDLEDSLRLPILMYYMSCRTVCRSCSRNLMPTVCSSTVPSPCS